MIEKVSLPDPTDARLILKDHLKIGREKPISYLPLATVEHVIGIQISEYTAMLEGLGNEFFVFGPEECCIKSGAVFAYSYKDLQNVLNDHHDVLLHNGWPCKPKDFVKRLASEWLGSDSPILPVVKRAFGER